ncbi:MAG: hypothetical protein L0287_13465 [Anaerolineae bacterium]|nr:hypothetical protein [Anaerolineae bacterium]
MADNVTVILNGVERTMKTREVDDVHTPVHINEAPYDEVTLLTNAITTGSAVAWVGGSGFWEAWGDFDGSTAQLQKTPDSGTTWINISGASLTADGGVIVQLPRDNIRVLLTGGGTNTSVSSKMKQA